MSSEELIEEILIEAHSYGFREELLERVKKIIDGGSKKYPVDIMEDEFNKILNELPE
jgi:undecaprenyl pyrophosphate synthase